MTVANAKMETIKCMGRNETQNGKMLKQQGRKEI
jgi:hypothetical protein